MIKKVFLYFLIVTGLLYGLRVLHYKGLLKQNRGYYAKYKTAFLQNNYYNVLFLGSSRVEMAYDTGLFDTLTGKNSFNLSLAGATPRISFAVLKTYLQKSRAPEEVYYEIDLHILKKRSSEIKEFNNYFPFLSDQFLRTEFSKIDARMQMFYFNPYYSWPYTGLKNISTSLHGWLRIPNKTDNFYYKGFLRETERPALTFNHVEPFYSYFDIIERAHLDSIIQLCRSKKIKLTLISSPIFGGGNIGLQNKKDLVVQVKNIAKINGLNYFDVTAPWYCDRRELFVDHYHLNYRGARLFTTGLAARIRKHSTHH